MVCRPCSVLFTIREEACGPFAPDDVNWEVRVAVRDGGARIFGSGRCCDGRGGRIKCEYEVPLAWAEKLREELESLTLPAAPDFTMGCDGGFTEFIVGDRHGGARYRWWSCPPRGWERLDEFAAKVLLAFKIIRRRAVRAEGAVIRREAARV